MWNEESSRRQVTAHGRIFTVKLLPCPAKRKIYLQFMFPRVAAHTLGHINRNIFRFSVGLRMFPVGIFVHVALVPAWRGWGYQVKEGNTEVGARMPSASVNGQQM
jgi:hypothetical protein